MRTTRNLIAVCGTGALMLAATACGSSDPRNAATSPNNAEGAPGVTTQQGQFPGANGKVAAVDGSTAQVQSQDNGQVAVTWNSATTFTKQVAATLGAVKVGSCVLVQPTEDSATAGSSAAPTAITASTVRVTPKASDGSCGGGLRGPGGGTPPPGGSSDGGPEFNGGAQPPEGQQPPSGTRPRVRGFGGAAGEVTAVSATGFSVTSPRPTSDSDGSGTPKTEDVVVTVTVNGSTAYTATATGAASDVRVGACLRAEGSVDDTGAVTARTVALSPAEDGQCTGGLMMRRGDAPGSGSTGSGSTGSTARES